MPHNRPAGPWRRLEWAVLVAGAVGLFFGARTFEFLADDAYIAFRYVHNSLHGRGLVWNPAPFAPVEGYTSFLWVKLLEGIWWAFGVDPTRSANVLALVCGYVGLAGAYALFRTTEVPGASSVVRVGLLIGVVLGTVGNRTVLAWMSSGLETALFNMLVIWWVAVAWRDPEARQGGFGPAVAFLVVALTLTRPDGLLFLAASAALLVDDALRRRRRAVVGWWFLAASGVAAHVLWRRFFYGAWFPNTYYAKHVAAWPESGLRYFASFALEYGLWLAAVAVIVVVSRPTNLRAMLGAARSSLHRVVVGGAIVTHVAYYTLNIGGDHFEYRVYSYLIPLVFVGLAALLRWGERSTIRQLAWLGAVVVVSWPIPWVHWALTRDLTTREQTVMLRQPIAEVFPAVLRPVVATWDDWQAWLISRFVGMRHQEHKVFAESQLAQFPSREVGLRAPFEPERPVLVWNAVGVPGWVLPNAAIIDHLGLNDRVIARSPIQREGHRYMAHDRVPPPGYVECFRGNVVIPGANAPNVGEPVVLHREVPLTDAEIIACETRRWY